MGAGSDPDLEGFDAWSVRANQLSCSAGTGRFLGFAGLPLLPINSCHGREEGRGTKVDNDLTLSLR